MATPAARATSASAATQAGAFPGPTPIDGVPLLAAALALFFEHRRFGMLPQRVVAWTSMGVLLVVGALLARDASGGTIAVYLLGDWPARIGIVLVQLSALAFAAQGVVPLDPGDTDATASRLHALAWMLWWIAFVPGALLLALGARRGTGFTLACLSAALLVPLLAVFAPIGLWVGVAQRLAFLLWFGWWLLASRGSR